MYVLGVSKEIQPIDMIVIYYCGKKLKKQLHIQETDIIPIINPTPLIWLL